MAVALTAVLSSAAFAVIDPASGTSTPNGDFVFVPNQIGTAAIKVVKTADDSVVQTMNVVSGTPASMVTSPNGATLFVVVTGATGSRVRSYSIDPSTGTLTSLSFKTLSATYTAGRQCALTSNGKYLYVANFDNSFADAGMRVYVLDVSNPSAMTVAGNFQVANYLWGIAMKPDGTRLYIGSRDNSGYKVYVYNIVNRTNPSLVTSINLGTAKDPTYLAVNSDGDRLFVRVFESSAPKDDVLVYDISGSSPSLVAEVYKIKGNNFRTALPGDHLPSGTDYDTRNGFEGLALSPNGWFMYFSCFDGPSADGKDYWRDTLYGTSVSNLSNGFDRTSSSDIWVSWGGCTQESPDIWGGWHSSDGLIATRKHKVYYTYSDDSISPSFFSVTTTADANTPPTAPTITKPLTNTTNVTGYISWEPSSDDGGANMLTYTVEYIKASVLEGGTTSWQHLAYTASGEIYTALSGEANTAYYARVQAYDGRYTSPWSYTGPYTLDPNFIGPTTWVGHYLVTGTSAVIDWGSVAGADNYIIEYKTVSDGSWTRTSDIASTYKYNSSDPNPNYQLTGLTAGATYLVRVITKKGGAESVPSVTDTFYALERPWVSHAKITAANAYILWGPETTSALDIPGATSYQYQYRVKGAGSWTSGTQPLGKKDDATITTLNFNLTGLTASTTYEVRMRSVGAGGNSEWSATHEVYTLEKPWVDHAKAAASDAYILWGPDISTALDVPNATGYEYRYKKSSDTSWTTGTQPLGKKDDATMATLNFHLTGLTASTIYQVQMRAVATGGNSDWSLTHEVYTIERPWVDHAKGTATSAYILWGPEVTSALDVPNATSYEYRYKKSSDTSWTTGTQPLGKKDDAIMTTLNFNLTGLTASTIYQVQMRAVGASGNSDWSGTHEVYTIERPWVDHAKVSATSAYILWGPEVTSALDVPNATSYEYRYKKSSDTSWTTGTQPLGKKDDATMTTLNFNLTGLTASTIYQVQMRAVGAAGNSDWSGTHEVYTIERPWVSSAKVTATSAYVLWGPEITSALNIPNATSYEYRYKKNTDGSWTSGTQPLSKKDDATMATCNFQLTGLTASTLYQVQMRAVGSGGNSDWSATHEVYTIERPWVDHAKTTASDTYILWGPEVSGGLDISGATGYEYKYRIKGAGSWTSGTQPLSKKDDATMAACNFNLTGLSASTGYEVMMRATYAGGASEWSATNEVYTMERPWVEHAKVTATSAYILWGPEISIALNIPNATSYEYKYKKSSDTSWTNGTQPLNKKDDATMATLNFNLTGLTASTTYQVQMRAVGAGGNSDWSPTHEVYTIERPWVNHAKVTSASAYVLWGPEITSALDIPGATSYQYQYRVKGAGSWTSGTKALGTKDDATMATLNFNLAGLSASTTYEVQMRAIGSGGNSDWSPTHEVYTLERPWVDHAKVSTNEAYVLWGPEVTSALDVPNATGYEYQYRIKGAGSWNSGTQPLGKKDDATIATLNFKLSGLTSSTTYEVKMRAVSASGASDWSATNEVFTMERPWVSHTNTGNTDTYILWGPEISTSELNVPSAVSYGYRYKKTSDTSWTTGTQPLNKKDDGTMAVLNFHLTGLTASTTYEVQMRAVGSSGVSDWSSSEVFMTIKGPWWIDVMNIGNTSATIFWENVSSPQYELMYSKAPSAEGGTTVVTTDAQRAVTGLDASTTYYAKVRAITASGKSDWSPVKSFFTMAGPNWIANYSTTTTQTMVTWEAVSGITSYEVNYGVSTEPMSWASWAPTPQDQNYGGPITGLTPRTWYKLRVNQHTGANASGWSSVASFFTIPVPNNVAITATTANTASITWEPVDMGGTPCTSYEVSWGLTTDAVGSGDAMTGNVNYMMTGLTNGLTYYVKIRARDDANNGYSDWTPYPALPFIASVTIPAPVWVNHYLAASHEAVVDWASVATADHYLIEYKKLSDPNWTTIEVLSTDKYNPSDPNPNYHLTGLDQLATYEVQVKAKQGALVSVPSTENTFYTLERPWADTYKSASTQAYITWGPEVNTTEVSVPLSNHYDLQYRVDGGAWTDSSETLNNSSFDDATNLKLNILFDSLTADSTYEIRVRTVDNTSGVSDWSDIKTFHTIRGPWWIDATVTGLNDATIFWDNVSAPQYEMRYSLDPTVEAGITTVITTDAERSVTGLTEYTTYYTKVRALTATGPSDWSPVKSFYTMPGPIWIANYLTTTTQTMITWEGVAGITSYEVNYGISTEPMSWTSWAPTPQTQNYGGPITGLTPRTWYQLRVNQHTGALVSTWSFVDKFFTIPAPNNVKWTGSTSSTASITWEPVNLDVGVPCTSYEVSWGVTFDAEGLGTMMTSEPYATMSMPLNTVFYVKVRARDDVNSGWSDWTWYGDQSLGAAGAHPIIVSPNATVNGIDVSSGWRGTTVKIQGINFGSTTGTVSFGATAAQPGYWKNDEIAVSVPPGAVTGSNAITVIRSDGNVASHVPSTFSFDVTDGGFVMDDFEGGVWQFATWEGAGSVTITKNYTGAQERTTYQSAECTGSSNFEIVGGVSTYGDLPTENGYDISSCKQIKLWFKGDGTSNVATFELVESNQATGNNPAIPLAAEVWKYNVPISMSSTSWQQITIDLTMEGTNKFVLDTGWWTGNSALDLNKIKSYQILTSGGNPKKYAVDYIFATTGGPSKTYAIRYIDELNSENWISIPYSGTGITNSLQLAQSISSAMPGAFTAGDNMVVTVRDNATQTPSQGWNYYDGANWSDLFGSPVTINPGDAISVVISNPGRPQISSNWTIAGSVLPVGSGGKQYTIRYIDEVNSESWTVLLDNITGITNSEQLAQSIKGSLPGVFTAGDIMVVTVRDNATQTVRQGWNFYDGANWIDIFGLPVAISSNDFVSIVVSNPGRSAISGIWP